MERTRKRSEGFPPDRKVEKKKGEEGGPPGQVLCSRARARVEEAGRGAGPGQGGFCGCSHVQVLRSLLAAEPSVEEKLQKLHSEIKFALKVDNPVRPSSGCGGSSGPGSPPAPRVWSP